MNLAGIMRLIIQHQIKQSENMHNEHEEVDKWVYEKRSKEAKDRMSVKTQLLQMQLLQQKHMETLQVHQMKNREAEQEFILTQHKEQRLKLAEQHQKAGAAAMLPRSTLEIPRV